MRVQEEAAITLCSGPLLYRVQSTESRDYNFFEVLFTLLSPTVLVTVFSLLLRAMLSRAAQRASQPAALRYLRRLKSLARALLPPVQNYLTDPTRNNSPPPSCFA